MELGHFGVESYEFSPLAAYMPGYGHQRRTALTEFDDLINEKAADSQIIKQ